MGTKITCKQAVDFISKREEGKLSATQRLQLWQHLAICSLCRIFSRQNKILQRLLSLDQHKNTQQLSASEKENLVDRILNGSNEKQ